MSKSSILLISVLLIFEMPPINDSLLLKASFLSLAFLSGFSTPIVPLATIYASL